MIEKTLKEYLPFIATEDLMMEASAKMKNGEECDLLDRLAAEKEFGLTESEIQELLDPSLYVGRCPEQTQAFVDKIRPLLADVTAKAAEIEL